MRKYVHVQPAVAAIVAELGDDTISVAEVAKRVYRLRWVEKKHKVAVLRVLHASPDVGLVFGSQVYHWPSYAGYCMARRKLILPRACDAPPSPADFAPGGQYHEQTIEGGEWWLAFQIEAAKRSGDHEREKALRAEEETRRQKAIERFCAFLKNGPLACLLCGRSESEVEVLVPVERGHVCNACVDAAVQAVTAAQTVPPRDGPCPSPHGH